MRKVVSARDRDKVLKNDKAGKRGLRSRGKGEEGMEMGWRKREVPFGSL